MSCFWGSKMQDWTKEKLEAIDNLYPPSRLSRSKERWRCVWQGKLSLGRYPSITLPRYGRPGSGPNLRIFLRGFFACSSIPIKEKEGFVISPMFYKVEKYLNQKEEI